MSRIDDDTRMIDEDLYEVWAVDNALDADKDDPFAGDDPPFDYLAEQDEPGAGSAFCAGARRTDIPFSDESPF